MLLAVQQLVDAMSAMLITHKLITQQPASQQALPAAAAAAAAAAGSGSSSSGSGSSRSPAECVQWQQELLLHELVEPIHGSFSRLLQELSVLTGLVGLHVRKPTDASRAQLSSKVSDTPGQAAAKIGNHQHTGRLLKHWTAAVVFELVVIHQPPD